MSEFPDYETMTHREYNKQIKKLRNKHVTWSSTTGYLRVQCRNKNNNIRDEFKAIATIEIPAFTMVKNCIWLNFIDMETKYAYLKNIENFDGTEINDDFECRLNGLNTYNFYKLEKNKKIYGEENHTVFYNTNKEDLKKSYGW
ncbi:hypothetical protein QLL95_gp0066 [Cotonvirus japonicus]|uniref:Uncharacterized protein n=1 Tax=Cotonvirus japonicus TaxID=2811091 RepID=A0ABM7NQX6_9VIRU|nr:hypothetical protein QLL95_gp0066 [Cotonvirus japonicus]BCS82555.1 hypothetical protein [Cotonvirus japonicus]